ncbi:MAG: BrnA antitoxin family protein [Paludibacterium sp.]|uniref:BrnA antitoxin family protein n=1 Tax=Paludibacterium sp. TaxID=1917523 RepID=UPI0025F68BEF|nr:BrnA antitoxin family protein [Paludibacterium sp.]MBV8048044.1 BrnA antitoxin family protein [Paludibacterium sp.]MBV8647568.1 BrnA antitoxin family protein [Paludibacterium sp.]
MTKKPFTNEEGEVRDLSEEIKHFKPASEALAGVLPSEVLNEMMRKKTRGPQKTPTKEQVTLRLSKEVLDAYRATGRGWQSRIDDDLKAIVHGDKAA